jgi:putative membrane protein
MKFLIWLVVNALALGAAAWLFDGITVTGDTSSDRVLTLVIVGAIFGVITSCVRPIVRLLSLPLIIVTLGLMLFVINALMLLLTSWIADQLNLGFKVDGFWVALWGSIVISLASIVLEAVFPHPAARH